MKKTEQFAAMMETKAAEMSKPAEPTYKQHILDLTKPIVDAESLLSIGNIATFPRGELIAVTGQAKQGKSQFLYYLIAVMLVGHPLGGVTPLLKSYKILLFDTEQSQANLQKCCQRALRFAGISDDENDKRFIPFFLRPLTIEDRLNIIEEAIKIEKPNIVFVDGIRDLLNDFNNIIESNILIQKLLGWITEYRCTIVCILHQNKNQGKEMRGHLGTELLNKATDCFEVKNKNGFFTISCTATRNIPCPDLPFSINEDGDFCEGDAPVVEENKNRASDEQRKQILRKCFSCVSELRYEELKAAYMENSGRNKRTAERAIKYCVENGILIKNEDKYSLSETPSI